ncbi:uncharacterized protein EI90DRAFT_3049231 [Cantharellus anzutake]|uniref:uncharacterized protein n=1 Tax=Cantharellus anzutake TaxID=1750568 RepID=UPI0019086EAA|nr:uncharacterized protein EI90DRAFT_3049231 [Cantharellus anzutake]KAF8335028.1 hypothetical protein EI90DRAFT_3049231 [Cantharellus anzutake]
MNLDGHDEDTPSEEDFSSRSPSSTTIDVPTLFKPSIHTTERNAATEEQLQEKFRKFWMAAVVDAFQDDLEQIRAEKKVTSNMLSILIESLASGADVYTHAQSSASGPSRYDEMDLVLSQGVI